MLGIDYCAASLPDAATVPFPARVGKPLQQRRRDGKEAAICGNPFHPSSILSAGTVMQTASVPLPALGGMIHDIRIRFIMREYRNYGFTYSMAMKPLAPLLL